jgi:uncharacterized protein (UPF0261 family)
MRKYSRYAAVLATSLFLALGAAAAGPAGVAFLTPGYDAASIASTVDKRVDPQIFHAAGSGGSAVERLMGKAGIAQRLSAH